MSLQSLLTGISAVRLLLARARQRRTRCAVAAPPSGLICRSLSAEQREAPSLCLHFCESGEGKKRKKKILHLMSPKLFCFFCRQLSRRPSVWGQGLNPFGRRIQEEAIRVAGAESSASRPPASRQGTRSSRAAPAVRDISAAWRLLLTRDVEFLRLGKGLSWEAARSRSPHFFIPNDERKSCPLRPTPPCPRPPPKNISLPP